MGVGDRGMLVVFQGRGSACAGIYTGREGGGWKEGLCIW